MAEKESEQRGFKALFPVAMRLFGFLGSYRTQYVTGGLAASLEMASALIMPYLYEQLVVVVESGGDSASVRMIIVLLAVLLLITPLICWGIYVQQNAVAYATGELRKTLFRHIQRLPVAKTAERKTGEYMTLMANDTARAGGMLGGFAITSLFRFVLLFTVSAVLLFLRDWRVALLSVVLSVMAFWVSVRLNPHMRALDRQAQ